MPAASQSSRCAAGVLGLGAEHGVAAAHVGQHGMRAAGLVAQGHAVVLARAAAIAIACAGRKEAAEDAVLGVEYGEVLIGDGLDVRGAGLAREFGHLRGVEIVRGSDPVEPEAEQFGGGDGVGGVQAEVAGQRARAAVRGARPGGPASAPESRNRSRSRKSTMRSSPGLSTRGLATRASMPAARTRSSEGRKP